ncbi:hypothetical protein R1flu_003482 [Riccia fluitans]|uniref:Uncharacterized protein n=1 Tax=Riccia fluitans TaxID=41844 RepID=A0ABD1Y956_9MARC
MRSPESIVTGGAQVSSLQELIVARTMAGMEPGKHCVNTPPFMSRTNDFECCMAPAKPVRRKLLRVVRSGNGEMRVVRDSINFSRNGFMEVGYADFSESPLRAFPTLDVYVEEGSRMSGSPRCRKDFRGDERDHLLRSSRFCIDFGDDLDDECTNKSKWRMDVSPLQSFILPPLEGR